MMSKISTVMIATVMIRFVAILEPCQSFPAVPKSKGEKGNITYAPSLSRSSHYDQRTCTLIRRGQHIDSSEMGIPFAF